MSLVVLRMVLPLIVAAAYVADRGLSGGDALLLVNKDWLVATGRFLGPLNPLSFR